MRRIMALITAVLVLCAGCGEGPEAPIPDTRAVSATVEEWRYSGGWAGESLELQLRLARWYGCNLQLEHPESGFREGYDNILAGPGGIMGWVEFPHADAEVPIFHDDGTGEGFFHRRETPFPIGEGGMSMLELSCRQQALWVSWLEPEPGQVFRIHILDRVITYRVQSVNIGTEVSGSTAAEDGCGLVFPRDGDARIALGIRIDP